MLASGGYPWTVIRIVDRKSYLSALDRASIEMDIHPFTTFIVRRVQWRLERHDLKFPAPKESFDLGRDMVFFYGRDGETWVRCAMSRETDDEHDEEHPKDNPQAAKPDGESPEGIRGSTEDRSQAGAEEAMDIATGRGDDAEQPEEASQPAEPDGGSPEGIRGSAEDRSRAGAEESRELSTAPGDETEESEKT